MRSGWSRMDRDIQKRLEKAHESGDPERIKREHQAANEAYGMGTGAIVGGVIGSFICPGLGTYLGAAIGGFFGHESAK